jgi:phosphorylcholine metabolism protein LicD
MVYSEILQKTAKVFEKLDIPFFLSSGTCLGYFRENKFLDHDYDIDVGVMADHCGKKCVKKIIKEMKNEGFDHYRSLGTYDTGLELSFRLPGTPMRYLAKIDIFIHYFTDNGKKIFWSSYTPIRLGKKRIQYQVNKFNLKKVNFAGTDVYVPHPTEKYLENHYGEDWMIPKYGSQYKYYSSPVSIV